MLGWAGFAGLRIAVAPGVFVPRRRTEFLLAQAVARTRRGAVVVDLCCGSGRSVRRCRRPSPRSCCTATDVDAAAVACARRNVRGEVYCGDLFDPLPATLRGRVDVLLANVPYVPSAAVALMPPEAREHEARAALDGGVDGLDVLRRVASAAPSWLAPGGSVFVETGADQARLAVTEFRANGLTARAVEDDDGATVVIGTRRAEGDPTVAGA